MENLDIETASGETASNNRECLSDSYSAAELTILLNSLSDAEKTNLCDGDYFISSNTIITFEVVHILHCIAECYSNNVNKSLEKMLPCLNDNLPVIIGRNIMRKYKNLSKKAEKLTNVDRSKLFESEIVLPKTAQWTELRVYFNFDKLNEGVLEENDPHLPFTVQHFIELGRFRSKCKCLDWSKICTWLGDRINSVTKPTTNAVSTDFCNLQRELYRLRSFPEKKKGLLGKEYVPPLPRVHTSTQAPSATTATENNLMLDLLYDLEEARNLELFSCYQELADLNVKYLKATTYLEKIIYDSAAADRENTRKVNSLKYELQRMTNSYENIKRKLYEKSVQLSKYMPRNVTKRENRRTEQIIALEREGKALELENSSLKERVVELEERLTASNALYDKERKRVFYYKNRGTKEQSKDQREKLQNLNDYIEYLENENSKLTEDIKEFLEGKEIKTFCHGKYNDEVRILYYELLSMNVSVENCEKVIRSVLGRLANLEIARLPRKSVASVMMVEGRMLAMMQAGEAILQSKNNVLHLDGTRLNFEEIGSFQVVTESGAYTFGIEDMISGESKTYLQTFRDLLTEAAALLTPNTENDDTAANILLGIKNVMTDRCSVNKNFVLQLKEWRDSVIPKVLEDYSKLAEEEKIKLSRINHLFCGIHVLHNLGVYAEESVKEFEKIASEVHQHSGFHTQNSRTYDLLFEISKLCSYTHGDQRNGKAKEWRAFLQKKGSNNKIVSFLHHRFNIYFVLGGAVYFHRSQLKEFLLSLDGENFLKTSVLCDIDIKLYLASFRALGILNKLVTGPLYRKIEEEGHIFKLNKMWSELKYLFESCAKDASPLMEQEILLSSVQVSKDDIYEELFRETGDLELDTLTQECIEIICCSCAVVVARQLGDQLPGGKYYQPTQDIIDETSLCQRSNVLSERDFAQMDRKVKQKQNISTIAACGTIMFLNNRTLGWLLEKSEEDLSKYITVARKAAPLRIKSYREKKKQMLEKRFDCLEKKRIEKEVKEQEKFDERTALLAELEKFGGVWNSTDKLEEESAKLKDSDLVKAFQLQIKARKVILHQIVPDGKILQQGSTIEGKYSQHKLPQLRENLLKAISFSEMSIEQRASELATKFVPRPEEERQRMLEDAKTSLRTKADKCASQSKNMLETNTLRKKRPKLFGKRIKHKWDDGWYLGTVVKVYGDDEYAVDCEFGVQYDDFPEEYEVNLMEDWENNWVVICKGGAQDPKEKEGKTRIIFDNISPRAVMGDSEMEGQDPQEKTQDDGKKASRPERKKRKLQYNC